MIRVVKNKNNQSSVIGDLDEAEDVVVRVRLEGGQTRRREGRGQWAEPAGRVDAL